MNNDVPLRDGRTWLSYSMLAPLAICVIYIHLCLPYIIDDAYITFAYSKNLHELGALVFRQGNNVAATSSFAWATLLGLLSNFAWNPVIWSKVLGAACYISTIFVVITLLHNRTTPSLSGVLTAIATALPFGFALWSNYGMENGLLGLMCFATALTLPKQQKIFIYLISPLLLLGICITRPEGFGYAMAAWSAEFTRRWIVNEDKTTALNTLIIAVALFGVFEFFYYQHFGVLLPDSATSKIQAPLKEKIQNGWIYLKDPANLYVIWIAPVAIGFQIWELIFSAIDPREERHAPALIGGALTIAALTFSLLSGGDWMPAARFLAFALPFCAGYIAWGLHRHLPDTYKLPATGFYVIVLLGTQIAATTTHLDFVKKLQDGTDSAVITMIDELNRTAREEDVIALSDIGYASYAFKGDVFDWWGLASRPVREKGESLGRIRSETIRAENPEYLVVYSNTSLPPQSVSQFDGAESMSKGIVSDAHLMARYCLLKNYYFWAGRYHALMARRDHAAEAESTLRSVFPAHKGTCFAPAVNK